MRRLWFVGVLLAAAWAQDSSRGPEEGGRPKSAPAKGHRWALLIGINAYKTVPSLQFCVQDMKTLRDVLVRHGGYAPERIALLVDDGSKGAQLPTRENIALALDRIVTHATPLDTVLVAFAGHGQTDGTRSFVLLRDSSPKRSMLPLTAMPIGVLHDLLRRCRARRKVLILDACHSGGARGVEGRPKFDPSKLLPAEGILELFSCGVDEVSFEDSRMKQGVFSHFLARGLEGEADTKHAGNKDGLVSADELYSYAHAEVTALTRKRFGRQQTPKKRGEVSGTMVLAARGMHGARPALTVARTHHRLEQLRKSGRVSDDLVAKASAWLGLEADFGPARRVRLALSILAQGYANEAQFRELTRVDRRRLDLHLASKRALVDRRVLVISAAPGGMPGYRDNRPALTREEVIALRKAGKSPPQMWFPLPATVRECQFIANSFAAAKRDTIVLANDNAQVVSFRGHVREIVKVARAGDLVVVAFSGFALKERGWCLWNEGGPGWISMESLREDLENCPSHVLVLSFAGETSIHWRTRRRGGGIRPPKRVKNGSRRVFVGYEGKADDSGGKFEKLGMSKLAESVARGVYGAADGNQDGFVTLRELSAYLAALSTNVHTGAASTWKVNENLSRGDVVISHNRLAID